MPDRTRLRVGDRIRVIAVPDFDLAQREREIQERLEDAGSTGGWHAVASRSDESAWGEAWARRLSGPNMPTPGCAV
jgi:hypothetical protein